MAETNTQETQTQAPPSLTVNDLKVLNYFLDRMVERGAINTWDEIEASLVVRRKLQAFIEYVDQVQSQSGEAGSAGEETAAVHAETEEEEPKSKKRSRKKK